MLQHSKKEDIPKNIVSFECIPKYSQVTQKTRYIVANFRKRFRNICTFADENKSLNQYKLAVNTQNLPKFHTSTCPIRFIINSPGIRT